MINSRISIVCLLFITTAMIIRPVVAADDGVITTNAEKIKNYRGKKIAPIETLQKIDGDEINPPEKFKVVSKIGNIPRFIETSRNSQSNSLFVHTGFIDDIPVIILTRLFNDFTQEVIDIHEIPKELLEWQLVTSGEKRMVILNHAAYAFSNSCVIQNNNHANHFQFIVGLAKPKLGKEHCSQKSTDVVKAWRFDGSKYLNEINPSGIICSIITMYDCN